MITVTKAELEALLAAKLRSRFPNVISVSVYELAGSRGWSLSTFNPGTEDISLVESELLRISEKIGKTHELGCPKSDGV